jgi:hypothetical protein
MEAAEVPGFRLASRKALCWLPILLSAGGLTAQTCLVLSPATISSDGVASMNLSLYSSPGTAPSALQWTLQYLPSNIQSLSVDDGPMLTAAGKTAMCTGNAAAYNCLAVGLNATTIASGIIAKVTAWLAPGTGTPAISIAFSLAASAAGNVIPISARVVGVTGANITSDCRLHPPLRGSVVGR